jgi:hypothetical protein
MSNIEHNLKKRIIETRISMIKQLLNEGPHIKYIGFVSDEDIKDYKRNNKLQKINENDYIAVEFHEFQIYNIKMIQRFKIKA